MASLIEYQHRDSTSEEGDVSQKLRPLLEGKGVVLEVRDTSIAPKSRVPKPLLFLAPGDVYGLDSRVLVVTLMGHGGEVIDTTQEIRMIHFIRIGVGARTAKVLSRALTTLYSEVIQNGNITQEGGFKPP